jgi:hypothetical protein
MARKLSLSKRIEERIFNLRATWSFFDSLYKKYVSKILDCMKQSLRMVGMSNLREINIKSYKGVYKKYILF